MIDTTIRRTFRFHMTQLWEYRDLLENLVRRDIKAQTKQSLLGYVWIFIPPLFQTGLFSLLFQAILKVQMTESIPYPLYLYMTTLPWQMFAGMLAQGTISVVGHGGLLKQVYFPKEVVIISTMAAEAFKTLIASTALIALMIYFGVGIGVHVLWVPLLVAIQLLFTLGLIMPLSALNAVVRDVSKAIGIGLMVWMYLTPVVYPLEKVPAEYRSLYLLNPMAILIQGYRDAILENRMPDPAGLLVVAAVSVTIFAAGYALFKRAEGSFADII